MIRSEKGRGEIRSQDQPLRLRLLHHLDRIPLLRRANAQTWLVLTNLFFLVFVTAVVGVYVRFWALPNVQHTLHSTVAAEGKRIIQLLNEQPTAEGTQAVLEQAHKITGAHLVLKQPDGVLMAPAGLDVGKLPQISVLAALENTAFDMGDGLDGTPKALWAIRTSRSSLLYLEYPVSPFLALAQNDTRNILLVAVLLAVAMVFVASWLASYKLTEPLRRITRTAKRINDGHFDEEIAIVTQTSELQELADSLNQMALRFKSDITELKKLTNFQNEFIGNVSHEVRNPIFSLGGYLEALSSPDLTPELRRNYAEKGLNNVQRLNNLFEDLIEIARLEYKEDAVKWDYFDLNALVDEVADELDYLVTEKHLELIVENAPMQVYADRVRIRQVLINLTQNALAYTDEGHVRVRYRRHGDKCRIEVTDTGRGIPEDHLPRIFDRFYRVDAARSRAMGGTGLGLSIVKQIIQAHGTEIHVESTVNRGTRFWFDLPIKK